MLKVNNNEKIVFFNYIFKSITNNNVLISKNQPLFIVINTNLLFCTYDIR